MRDWAERNLISTTARLALPAAPPLPLRVSFIMPVTKLFASILAPDATRRLERWAIAEQATEKQRDVFMEALYSVLAAIDRLAGITTHKASFRKPQLARTLSAQPIPPPYRPPAISAVSPAQKHMEVRARGLRGACAIKLGGATREAVLRARDEGARAARSASACVHCPAARACGRVRACLCCVRCSPRRVCAWLPASRMTLTASPLFCVPPSAQAMRRAERDAMLAMAEAALREGRVVSGNGGESVKDAIQAHPFKSQVKPIGGIRVGPTVSSAQAAANGFSVEDRKKYAGACARTHCRAVGVAQLPPAAATDAVCAHDASGGEGSGGAAPGGAARRADLRAHRLTRFPALPACLHAHPSFSPPPTGLQARRSARTRPSGRAPPPPLVGSSATRRGTATGSRPAGRATRSCSPRTPRRGRS
jgi:hypothetical protein